MRMSACCDVAVVPTLVVLLDDGQIVVPGAVHLARLIAQVFQSLLELQDKVVLPVSCPSSEYKDQ